MHLRDDQTGGAAREHQVPGAIQDAGESGGHPKNPTGTGQQQAEHLEQLREGRGRADWRSEAVFQGTQVAFNLPGNGGKNFAPGQYVQGGTT